MIDYGSEFGFAMKTKISEGDEQEDEKRKEVEVEIESESTGSIEEAEEANDQIQNIPDIESIQTEQETSIICYLTSIGNRNILKPCGGCGELVSGVHRCSTCNAKMHVFCGTRVGEEGYGQDVICKKCSKDTGVDKEHEFDEDLDITPKKKKKKVTSKKKKI